MVAKEDYSAVNLPAVANFLANVDWYSFVDSLVSTNNRYEMFVAVLQHAIALFTPMIRIHVAVPLTRLSQFSLHQNVYCIDGGNV